MHLYNLLRPTSDNINYIQFLKLCTHLYNVVNTDPLPVSLRSTKYSHAHHHRCNKTSHHNR